MKVDTDQFMRDGYLLLRNVVPADELADMRLTAELMVDAAKRNSQAARQEGDPQGGDWYADVQPRVQLHKVVTEETAHLVDFLLGENTLGVSAQLLSGPETAICSAEISCSGLILSSCGLCLGAVAFSTWICGKSIVSSSQRMTERSMMFSSSRILPGQEYPERRSMAAVVKEQGVRPRRTGVGDRARVVLGRQNPHCSSYPI